MRLRYQVTDPDGKVVYDTESFADAKQQWRLKAGSGYILVDVLHNAGLVLAAGDNRMLYQTAHRMIDQLFAELPGCCGYFATNHRRKDALWTEMVELIERWAVTAVTSTPI